MDRDHVNRLVRPEPPNEGTRALAARLLREAARGAPPLASAHLVVLDGPLTGRRIHLGPSQTLGRGRAAAIRLPDSEASRIHARICVAPEAIHVEDLGSKNGVRLNGERMRSGSLSLQPGDQIGIGSTTLALVAPTQGGTEPVSPEPNIAPPATSAAALRAGRTRVHLARWPAWAKPPALALVGAAALLAAAAGLGLAASGN